MGTFFFFVKCRVKEEERVRGSPPTVLDKWLKKMTTDDTGLTRPPDVVCVSGHKDEVRSIDHGYFQSQFRVSVYKEVGRPTHDSIKREQVLTKVTNVLMTWYIIPIDTNQLSKLPSRTDVEQGCRTGPHGDRTCGCAVNSPHNRTCGEVSLVPVLDSRAPHVHRTCGCVVNLCNGARAVVW